MTNDLSKTTKKLIVAGSIMLIVLVMSFLTFDFVTIGGNQVGVKETFTNGVEGEPLPARTYIVFKPTTTIFAYPTDLQVFVMNDIAEKQGESSIGRENDAYLVQSDEGQDMHISLNVQWCIDPKKVIHIHTEVGRTIEEIVEKAIRPSVMKIVKNQATKREAIKAYSGEGLTQLQSDIETELASETGDLRKSGIYVKSFVIEKIRLDPLYIGEITKKQVATQRKLRADEETKAAEAEALRAKAEAQADLNTKVVQAERDKQVGVLESEKKAKQQVIEAEGEKEKLVLEGTGKRDAAILEAEGIIALGKAEAEAKKLNLQAYAVEGAESFVKIEIAKSFAQSMSEVKGYLPMDMNIYTLGSNFQRAIEQIVSPNQAPAQSIVPKKVN